MLMKKKTCLFQHKVDWKNPFARVSTVIDRDSRATATFVASTPARKQSKQQRCSSTGIGRDLSKPLPGLAVEWNVNADFSWVWSNNQEGATKSDPELLTRLLRQTGHLQDKSDYLAEEKKVVPVEVMTSAYKKFLAPNSTFSVQATHKGSKGKGKGKARMPEGKTKARWINLYPAQEEINHDLLMLSHLELALHRDDETYVVIGPNSLKVRVTKENWNTLRFNTKTSNPEYFPSSYLKPVPTVLSETGDASTANFPRSTINGTVEDFRTYIISFLLPFSPRTPRSPLIPIGR
jgi:hypothetical protein